MKIEYPLNIEFKIFTISNKFSVTDSENKTFFYVEQKFLKFKEHVEVFTDNTKEKKICDIHATKIIDFSSSYNFTDAQGNFFGGIRRKGLHSLWKARYEIYSGNPDGAAEFDVREESILPRVLDTISERIPIVGIFSGFIFNPTYIVNDSSGNAVMKIIKKRSLLESKFSIESLSELSDAKQIQILISLLIFICLEHKRS